VISGRISTMVEVDDVAEHAHLHCFELHDFSLPRPGGPTRSRRPAAPFCWLICGFELALSHEALCHQLVTCTHWRREWDSNPRYAINVYTLSKRAP
jgi:hypothetical protein